LVWPESTRLMSLSTVTRSSFRWPPCRRHRQQDPLLGIRRLQFPLRKPLCDGSAVFANNSPMRLATVVRDRSDQARRRPSRLGRESRGVGGCHLTRRHGGVEPHAENIFRIGFSPWRAAQESRNPRAPSQRRSYGCAARLTPARKADHGRERRIPPSGLVHDLVYSD
jgi:hypothetical protein